MSEFIIPLFMSVGVNLPHCNTKCLEFVLISTLISERNFPLPFTYTHKEDFGTELSVVFAGMSGLPETLPSSHSRLLPLGLESKVSVHTDEVYDQLDSHVSLLTLRSDSFETNGVLYVRCSADCRPSVTQQSKYKCHYRCTFSQSSIYFYPYPLLLLK